MFTRILSVLTLSTALYAQEPPLLIHADKISYTQDSDVLIAEGNIEISQFLSQLNKKASFFKKKFKSDSFDKNQNDFPERYLKADKLTYNRKTKILTFTGNIIFIDENDNVIHASKLEFDDKFEDGFVEDIKILLAEDEGRLTAESAERKNGNENRFHRAIYSPCKICKDSPIPIWQLRAREVIHDQEEQKLKYKDVSMDIYGVPTLYTPYFFHPDPSVKRKSGFLFPTFGHSTDLGSSIRVPYFYVIDPHSDLLITPTITTKQGPVLFTQYRKRFERGELELQGSITHTKHLDRQRLRNTQNAKVPPRVRYHISAKGRFELSDYDLITFDINRASDTTYLRRYNIVSDSPLFAQNKNLTSEARYERFKGNAYGVIKGYAFQTDRPRTTPAVFPLARWMHQTDPGRFGEIFNFDAHIQSLHRKEQIKSVVPRTSHRGVAQAKMYVPYVMRTGQMLEWESSVRSDAYHIDTFTRPDKNRSDSYAAARLLPQTALTMRYPLLSSNKNASWMLEPLMQLNLAPSGLNPTKIPNEDSRLSELDDVNLFFLSRMNGFDQTDSGQRFVYGLNNSFYGPNKIKLNWFIGQSKRLNRRVVRIIGEREQSSDYVTRVQLFPSEWFRIHYRGRFSPKGSNRFSEITTNFGKPILSLNSSYIFVTKFDTPGTQDIKQVNMQLSSKIHENWLITLTQNRNLAKAQKSAQANMLSIAYENDCFQTSIGVFQTKYRDRDIKPSKGFLIQFSFKNLGTVRPLASSSFPTILTRRLD